MAKDQAELNAIRAAYIATYMRADGPHNAGQGGAKRGGDWFTTAHPVDVAIAWASIGCEPVEALRLMAYGYTPEELAAESFEGATGIITGTPEEMIEILRGQVDGPEDQASRHAPAERARIAELEEYGPIRVDPRPTRVHRFDRDEDDQNA